MQLNNIILSLAVAATITTAGPISARQDGPGHQYTCDSWKDAAGRKKYLQTIGADAHDLAITMLETSCDMSGMAYPYGDVYPDKDKTPKTGDFANFGLFKNNWGVMRTYCTDFMGQQESEWRNGDVLNKDDVAAIKCQHETMTALGDTGFYVEQRGAGGAAGGEDYGNAIKFIYDFLNDGHLADNEATFFTLHPV